MNAVVTTIAGVLRDLHPIRWRPKFHLLWKAAEQGIILAHRSIGEGWEDDRFSETLWRLSSKAMLDVARKKKLAIN